MSKVNIFKPKTIHFRKVAHPEPLDTQNEITSWWHTYQVNHPSLFNGDLIACCKHHINSNSELTIDWYRTKYAHYILRAAPEINIKVKPARAIYCSIALVSTANRVLIAQMSKDTASPNRLQLPGGNIEIQRGQTLTLNDALKSACRELLEEIGIQLLASDLKLWKVKLGGDFNDIGLIFTNSVILEEEAIKLLFESHIYNLQKQNLKPEIQQLLFINSFSVDFYKESIWVDYLPEVIENILNKEV